MNPITEITMHIIALLGDDFTRGTKGSWTTKNKLSPSIDDTDKRCMLSPKRFEIILFNSAMLVFLYSSSRKIIDFLAIEIFALLIVILKALDNKIKPFFCSAWVNVLYL